MFKCLYMRVNNFYGVQTVYLLLARNGTITVTALGLPQNLIHSWFINPRHSACLLVRTSFIFFKYLIFATLANLAFNSHNTNKRKKKENLFLYQMHYLISEQVVAFHTSYRLGSPLFFNVYQKYKGNLRAS